MSHIQFFCTHSILLGRANSHFVLLLWSGRRRRLNACANAATRYTHTHTSQSRVLARTYSSIMHARTRTHTYYIYMVRCVRAHHTNDTHYTPTQTGRTQSHGMAVKYEVVDIDSRYFIRGVVVVVTWSDVRVCVCVAAGRPPASCTRMRTAPASASVYAFVNVCVLVFFSCCVLVCGV